MYEGEIWRREMGTSEKHATWLAVIEWIVVQTHPETISELRVLYIFSFFIHTSYNVAL
jgi:hypothetical protein